MHIVIPSLVYIWYADGVEIHQPYQLYNLIVLHNTMGGLFVLIAIAVLMNTFSFF